MTDEARPPLPHVTPETAARESAPRRGRLEQPRSPAGDRRFRTLSSAEVQT